MYIYVNGKFKLFGDIKKKKKTGIKKLNAIIWHKIGHKDNMVIVTVAV